MHELATKLIADRDAVVVVILSFFATGFMVWVLIELLLDGKWQKRRPLVHVEKRPNPIHIIRRKP